MAFKLMCNFLENAFQFHFLLKLSCVIIIAVILYAMNNGGGAGEK